MRLRAFVGWRCAIGKFCRQLTHDHKRKTRLKDQETSELIRLRRPAAAGRLWQEEDRPRSVIVLNGNVQMTGRVAHDDENGILPDIHEVVVVRKYNYVLKTISHGNVGAHLELADAINTSHLQNTAGTGNIVGQAVSRVGIARGAVENFGAEGNLVVPGRHSAAAIVAPFESERDDCATGLIFMQWPCGEGFGRIDMRGIARLGQCPLGRNRQ